MNGRVCAVAAAVLTVFLLAACGVQEGALYSLDEAYDNGWLTQEDLKNIAYYYGKTAVDGEYGEEGFVPGPKVPEILDSRTQDSIKRTYRREILELPRAPLDRIVVRHYLGTYNGCIVVDVTDVIYCYDYLFEPEREIGGVVFRKYCASLLRVWRTAG